MHCAVLPVSRRALAKMCMVDSPWDTEEQPVGFQVQANRQAAHTLKRSAQPRPKLYMGSLRRAFHHSASPLPHPLPRRRARGSQHTVSLQQQLAPMPTLYTTSQRQEAAGELWSHIKMLDTLCIVHTAYLPHRTVCL